MDDIKLFLRKNGLSEAERIFIKKQLKEGAGLLEALNVMDAILFYKQ